MNVNTYWGNITVAGNTITLDADQEKAQGEGGAFEVAIIRGEN
ncbi:MAG TPA: hypothetical protein VM537_34700 [Anaerolineae bacterium]|nr:hypothetical protein [Anaerolineae bacterium]